MPRRAAPLVVTRTADSVRVAWDNRAVPRRVLPFVILFAMSAAFAGATVAVGRSGSAFVALPAAGLSVAAPLAGYSFLSRRWQEAVELTRDAVTHNRTGFLAPGPRTYPLASIREIGFGHYPGTGDECEMMRTLNLVHAGTWLLSDRTYVGYWLRDGDLRLVFDELRAFAAEAGLPVRFALYDEERPTTEGIPPNAG